MKHLTFKNLKLIGIGLVIALGASYANAAFLSPTVGPTYGGIAAPINTGTVNQIKNGHLSVGAFSTASASEIDQNFFIDNDAIVHGGTPADADSIVSFGNTDSVVLQINGGVRTKQYLKSGFLSSSGVQNLCADDTGTVVPCP